MKLYTEEQLLKALWEALWESEHFFSDSKNVDRIIKSLTPIELPTDEDIEISAPIINKISSPIINRNGFIHGAKWMRDKITNTKEK